MIVFRLSQVLENSEYFLLNSLHVPCELGPENLWCVPEIILIGLLVHNRFVVGHPLRVDFIVFTCLTISFYDSI